MQTILRGLLIATVLLFTVGCSPETEDATWGAFLQEPTAHRLKGLEGSLAPCGDNPDCWSSKRPTSSELGMLVRLIESGNAPALSAGFSALRSLNFAAGDQEDLIRALACRIKSDPSQFLLQVHLYARDPDLLTMLPTEAIDDATLRLKEVDQRIDALGAVSNPDVRAEKDWAIGVLTEYRSQLLDPQR